MAAEAVVLVGGQGTRLRPLTVTTPKPMLPLAGVPFLTHQLARLRAAGIEHVVLATSYRPEVFAAHFGDGSALGIRLDYATETEPLGTGGAIRNTADLLESGAEDPIVILNGDVISGHDIAEQVRRHCAADAAVTLHLTRVDDARVFGCVPTDASGRVTAFVEKSDDPPTDQVNAGCYVFRRSVLDAIPPAQVVSVERETFPDVVDRGDLVLGYVEAAYWLDVGTPEAFVRGSCDVIRGVAASPAFVAEPGERLLLDGAQVAPDATIDGGTCIGRNAVVAAGAVVRGSVVLDGARIEPGAVVSNSAVGASAHIGAHTVLDAAVIGDAAQVGRRNELRNGARVWPGVHLPDVSVRFSTDA